MGVGCYFRFSFFVRVVLVDGFSGVQVLEGRVEGFLELGVRGIYIDVDRVRFIVQMGKLRYRNRLQSLEVRDLVILVVVNILVVFEEGRGVNIIVYGYQLYQFCFSGDGVVEGVQFDFVILSQWLQQVLYFCQVFRGVVVVLFIRSGVTKLFIGRLRVQYELSEFESSSDIILGILEFEDMLYRFIFRRVKWRFRGED